MSAGGRGYPEDFVSGSGPSEQSGAWFVSGDQEVCTPHHKEDVSTVAQAFGEIVGGELLA